MCVLPDVDPAADDDHGVVVCTNACFTGAGFALFPLQIKDSVLSTTEHASQKDAIKYEHNRFISCWATEDQVIGMTAFANKEKPVWKHR